MRNHSTSYRSLSLEIINKVNSASEASQENFAFLTKKMRKWRS